MDKEDKAIVILVLLGMLLVVTGIALISIPAALIVAGYCWLLWQPILPGEK